MNSISYQLQNYSKVAKNIAEQIGANLTDNHFSIPDELGKGSVQFVDFQEFSLMITKFQFYKETRIHRESSSLTGHFDIGFTLKGISKKFETNFDNNFKRMGFGAYLSTPSTYSNSVVEGHSENEQIFILFKRDWLQEFLHINLPEVLRYPNEPMLRYLTLDNTLVPVLYQLLNHGVEEPYRNSYLYSKALEVLTLFIKSVKEKDHLFIRGDFHPDDLQKVLQISGYLQSNLTTGATIESISDLFGLNRDKLQKVFKAVHGQTLGEYYREHRMMYAYNNIADGRLINEVGIELGYSNMSHFSRAFKKVHGINPSKLKYQK